MRTSLICQTRNIIATGTIGLIIGVSYIINPSFGKTPHAEAEVSDNVSGYAWSETIGWISFNNTSDGSATSYGVNVDTTNKATGGVGDFSGYAWSRGATNEGGIGWISFDRAKTGNPPLAPFDGGIGPIAQVDWATGNVTGWARALAGCEATPGVPVVACSGSLAGAAAGGWDGWIKLSDDSIGVWNGNGVRISGNRFSGYAWGGNDGAGIAGVVGWVDFSPTVGGVPVGVQVGATSCTIAEVDFSGTWGSCQPLDQCTGEGSQMVPGIQIGVCSGGSTVLQGCLVPQSCVAAPSGAAGTCGDGVCDTGLNETIISCPADCHSTVQEF